MNDQYYYAVDGKRNSPISIAQLRQLAAKGELNRNQKVWCKGMQEWQPAGSIRGLFDGLPPDIEVGASIAGQVPPPPPRERAPSFPGLSTADKRLLVATKIAIYGTVTAAIMRVCFSAVVRAASSLPKQEFDQLVDYYLIALTVIGSGTFLVFLFAFLSRLKAHEQVK